VTGILQDFLANVYASPIANPECEGRKSTSSNFRKTTDRDKQLSFRQPATYVARNVGSIVGEMIEYKAALSSQK
jgi:hypothetical protein